MASSSMASFLPPSTAGPTPQMKAYTKLLVQTAQTGVIADFSQYLVDHPVTPQKDVSKRIQEFLLHGTLDQQHREKAANFLFAQYDAADFTRTGRWSMCAYCKVWHPKHHILPMIPAADIENWHINHHNLCYSCVSASLDNQLLHPGDWLRVEPSPDHQIGAHTDLRPGKPDLTQTANRPSVLLTLDQEYEPELAPTLLDGSPSRHNRCHLRHIYPTHMATRPSAMVPHTCREPSRRQVRDSQTTEHS